MPVELPPTVAENWKFFVNAQLWPRAARFDPRGWLENFNAGDQKYAIRLLEGFTYFSGELVEALFRSAFQNLSQLVVQNKDNYFSASAQWTQFVESAILVRVEGNHSSEADSAFIFTRMAREIVGIQEEQILSPAKALERLRATPRGNVIFVDDFVGTGEQFETRGPKFIRFLAMQLRLSNRLSRQSARSQWASTTAHWCALSSAANTLRGPALW